MTAQSALRLDRMPSVQGRRLVAPLRPQEMLGDSPWVLRDLTTVVGRLVLSVAVVVTAWYGASGTVDWEDQLLWTAVSIGGVAFGLASVARWLLAGFRGVRYETQAVLTPLRQPEAHSQVHAAPIAVDAVVTCRGMTHYHRVDCLLVVGKAARQVAPAKAALLPCGVCAP